MNYLDYIKELILYLQKNSDWTEIGLLNISESNIFNIDNFNWQYFPAQILTPYNWYDWLFYTNFLVNKDFLQLTPNIAENKSNNYTLYNHIGKFSFIKGLSAIMNFINPQDIFKLQNKLNIKMQSGIGNYCNILDPINFIGQLPNININTIKALSDLNINMFDYSYLNSQITTGIYNNQAKIQIDNINNINPDIFNSKPLLPNINVHSLNSNWNLDIINTILKFCSFGIFSKEIQVNPNILNSSLNFILSNILNNSNLNANIDLLNSNITQTIIQNKDLNMSLVFKLLTLIPQYILLPIIEENLFNIKQLKVTDFIGNSLEKILIDFKNKLTTKIIYFVGQDFKTTINETAAINLNVRQAKKVIIPKMLMSAIDDIITTMILKDMTFKYFNVVIKDFKGHLNNTFSMLSPDEIHPIFNDFDICNWSLKNFIGNSVNLYALHKGEFFTNIQPGVYQPKQNPKINTVCVTKVKFKTHFSSLHATMLKDIKDFTLLQMEEKSLRDLELIIN